MKLGSIIAAFALAACGSTTPTGPGGQNCTITFSGALTGTQSCYAAAGNGYKSGSSGNGFGLGTTSNTVAQSFAFAVDLGSDSIGTGSYSNTATAKPAGAGATTSANKAWVMEAHSTSGDPDQGTYTLNLSDLGTGITTSNGTGYANPHGSLTVVLKPVTQTGAAGDLTATVSF